MKILIVKRDKIGDMLLATPLLSHLRSTLPDAQIDLVANDYNAWVVENHPAVNHLWVYRRARHDGRLRWSAVFEQISQRQAIRRARYDVAIAANGEHSSRAIARTLAARATQTVAYCDAPRRYGNRLSTPLRPAEAEHEIERLLGLAAPLRVAAPEAIAKPQFAAPTTWTEQARAWLAANGIAPGGYMVLGIGARYVETQPGLEQVVRWSHWVKKTLNWDTAIQYTPGDARNRTYPGSAALALQIRSVAPPHVHLIPPRIDLAVAIIELAGGSIFPDGGLMHFAALSPGGVVALFAADATLSSPQRWGPRGDRVTVVNAKRQIADVEDAEVLLPLLR